MHSMQHHGKFHLNGLIITQTNMICKNKTYNIIINNKIMIITITNLEDSTPVFCLEMRKQN